MGKVGLIQVVKQSPLGDGDIWWREVDEASLKVLGVKIRNKIYFECVI